MKKHISRFIFMCLVTAVSVSGHAQVEQAELPSEAGLSQSTTANAEADLPPVLVRTKKYGIIEFTAEAYAFHKKHYALQRATKYLIKKRKCEPSERDLLSNAAVHYSYACVMEVRKKSVIIYSVNQRSEDGVNFHVALLDDESLARIKQKTDYQMVVKQRRAIAGGPRAPFAAHEVSHWYRLTLIDIQDPENLEIAAVNLAEFDKTLDELEASTQSSVLPPKSKAKSRSKLKPSSKKKVMRRKR